MPVCASKATQRLLMPLFTKRMSKKKRRSQTRLGKTNEAESLALQFPLARIQTNWKDKIERIPGVIVAALVCYALFYFFTEYKFFVFEATIVGHRRVSAQEIYRTAGIEGESIFFLNRQEISSRIGQLPGINRATVTCQLPAGVRVDVIEREPVYIWQVGQTAYWLDEQGVVMEPRGEGLDSITFLDVDMQARKPGSRVNPEILQAARKLQEWLPEEKLFQWSETQGLSFRHRDGYAVYLGQLDNLEEKLTTLRALTEDFSHKGTHPEFVDMRFSGLPYYR